MIPISRFLHYETVYDNVITDLLSTDGSTLSRDEYC